MMDIDKIGTLLKKQEATSAVNKLIGQFCQLYPMAQNDALLDLFAKRSDSRVEMLWGVYEGYDSIRRCFSKAHPAKNDLDRRVNEMHLQNAMSIVICVADDGQTARAVWHSSGHASGKTSSRDMDGYWSYRNYAADFLCIDGQWKFWHLHVYDIFLCSYYKSWAKEAAQVSDAEIFQNYFHITGDAAPDRAPTTTWHFNENAVYTDGCPALPTPYKTFADVGYGY